MEEFKFTPQYPPPPPAVLEDWAEGVRRFIAEIRQALGAVVNLLEAFERELGPILDKLRAYDDIITFDGWKYKPPTRLGKAMAWELRGKVIARNPTKVWQRTPNRHWFRETRGIDPRKKEVG